MYLTYPMNFNVTPEITRNNAETFIPITCQENAGMTGPIHAIVWLMLNETLKAEAEFNRSLQACTYGAFNVRNEVCSIASHGGMTNVSFPRLIYMRISSEDMDSSKSFSIRQAEQSRAYAAVLNSLISSCPWDWSILFPLVPIFSLVMVVSFSRWWWGTLAFVSMRKAFFSLHYPAFSVLPQKQFVYVIFSFVERIPLTTRSMRQQFISSLRLNLQICCAWQILVAINGPSAPPRQPWLSKISSCLFVSIYVDRLLSISIFSLRIIPLDCMWERE